MKKAAFLFFRVEVRNAACAVQYLVVVQTMLVRCPKNLDFTMFQKVSLSNLIFRALGAAIAFEASDLTVTADVAVAAPAVAVRAVLAASAFFAERIPTDATALGT